MINFRNHAVQHILDEEKRRGTSLSSKMKKPINVNLDVFFIINEIYCFRDEEPWP